MAPSVKFAWHCPNCITGIVMDGKCCNCEFRVDTLKQEKRSDPVTAPSHYCRGGIELRQVIEAWGLDANAYACQAFQMIARHQFKGSPLEDLKKARQWLDFAIERMEKP